MERAEHLYLARRGSHSSVRDRGRGLRDRSHSNRLAGLANPDIPDESRHPG